MSSLEKGSSTASLPERPLLKSEQGTFQRTKFAKKCEKSWMSSSADATMNGVSTKATESGSKSPSKRRDSQKDNTLRGSGSPASYSSVRGDRVGSDAKESTAPPVLKPRTSRWADEVEEDDQFLPIASSPTQGMRARVPRREKVSSSNKVEHRPVPHPKVSEGRSHTRTADSYHHGRTEETRAPRPSRAKEVPRAPREIARPSEVRTHAAHHPSPQELAEIAHMKEIMAKKAEERKKLKEEEEARLEAERRARCEAKLREIEEKKRSKTSSPVTSQMVNPAENVPARVIDQGDEVKRNAFNAARRELRNQRERDRKGDERLEIIVPAVSSSSAMLSPNAREFVPVGPPMAPMHWAPYPPHHMQHPQISPQLPPNHHLPQAGHPGMPAPQLIQGQPPMGHMQHQVPPSHMGYGYPHQYPHFAYGYPPPPHQMANHYY